jgi:signal transduction histidine kinase
MFLLALFFTGGLSGTFYFISNIHQYTSTSYFDTPDFQSELHRYVQYVHEKETKPLTKEEIIKEIIVTNDEIAEHRYRYGDLEEQLDNIHFQYEDRIQLAEDGKSMEDKEALIKERDDKLADITKNFESDEYVKKKILEEKEALVEEYIANQKLVRAKPPSRLDGELLYYFRNSKIDQILHNLEASDEQAMNVFGESDMQYTTDFGFIGDHYHYDSMQYYDWLDQTIADVRGEWEGEVGVPATLSSSSEIMSAKQEYEHRQLLFWLLGAGSVLLLLISVFYIRKIKFVPEKAGVWQGYYNNFPVDLRILAVLGMMSASLLSLFFVGDYLIYYGLYHPFSIDGLELLISIFIASLIWLFTFQQARHLASGLKDRDSVKKEWNRGLSYRAFQHGKKLYRRGYLAMQDAFIHQSTGIQLFLVLGLVFCLGFSGIMIFFHPLFFLIYLLLLAFVGFPLFMVLVKSVGYFNKIVVKTKEMAVGKLGDNLDVKGKSVLSVMAANINILKQGVKVSLSEQAKSERLKTELITNVSHDLRTPLTSIITYTELLKNTSLPEEDRAAYLEIIDRKSQRLKGLIDDLFEVSKMASGNMDLVKERVDLTQLLQQALAEYDSSMSEARLHFRINSPEKPVYALVDGQKIWRVFDNLIGNIVKYSLENSRVYISVQASGEQARITFKNVSKYELNDHSEELFERFKRGDTSRHTEGSGLGLAIAKSIIDLHDGGLDMETDGDLFKVSITLTVVE